MRKSVVFLLGSIVVLCLASSPGHGAQEPPWCSSEELLEQILRRDPALRQNREAVEERRRVRLETGAAGGPLLTIPIVVHVIHGGVAVGTGENLSYAQILSQIQALQRDFQNGTVDTEIRFCLAKNPPSGQSWANLNEPGVTRTPSASLTQHDIGTEEAALKALDFFPSDRYLNIWVVKDITPAGVIGYAQFPGTVPASLDGIVMRYDGFGSNLLPSGGTFQLLPDNQDGKILAHEVGHYLDLYHTFHGGCYGPGDQVADTAAEATPANGCPLGRSTCGLSDPIDNFMDYTNDACRVAFTALQAERMRDAILTYRASLVDPVNLVTTGCANGASPTIQVDIQQACTGQPVKFSTVSSAAQIDWSFPGGAPASASGAGPHTVTYASPGVYDASITTNNAAGTAPLSLTKPGLVYVSACAPIASSQGNWYFGKQAGLSFATGQPVADLGSAMTTSEACVTQSDANGSLVFYSDSINVYDRSHQKINPSSPLKGHDSITQGALSMPVPGDPSRYFLFTLGDDDGSGQIWRTTVAINGASTTLLETNKLIPLPSGVELAEQMTAVPQCNGSDYWLIVKPDASEQQANQFLVYSVTAGGVSGPIVSSSALPSRYGSLKASPDGSMLAQCTVDHFLKHSSALYDFDRTTGAINLRTKLSKGNYGCSFSPDSRLLYMSTRGVNGRSQIYQYDVTVPNPDATAMLAADVSDGLVVALQLGPDQKIYISSRGPSGNGQGFLSVIHFPNQRNTSASPNACGFSVNGPALGGKLTDIGLPNMIDARPGLVPADFDATVSACSQVTFHARNCGTSFSWTFGDGSTSNLRDPVHTYAQPGTYNVQLTVTSGAGTTTVTKPVKVGIAPLSIAGPLNACTKPANYSINAVPGVSYTWQINGGTAATTTGSNVDVAWGTNGGTVQVTAMDPATGCQATASLPVGPCGPGCGGGVFLSNREEFLEPCPTCQSTWEAPCKSPGKATAAVTLCNNSTATQVYAWSLAGLPVVPGSPCSVEGPTEFVPASGQMTVSPGFCVTTPVTVTCQAGQPESAHGCFQLNAVELSTGAGLTCSGSTLISRRWLGKVDNLFYDVPFGTSHDIFFTVTNLDTETAVLDYTFSVMPSDMKPAEPIARLNGNAPGVPVPGTLRLAAGAEARIGVNVAFIEPKPFAPQDLLLSADLDGNGNFVVIASAGLRSSPADCNGNGVGDSQDIAQGTSADCNGNGTPDECDLAAGARDCNRNQVLDSCEVASGSTPDVNANEIPDSCEIRSVFWRFEGTAQGGQVTATIQGFSASCTVTITTSAGASAATVAAQLVAALNASPCLIGQDITALAHGAQVTIKGFTLDRDDVSIQITDPGLVFQAIEIPVLSPWGLLLLAILLLAIGWRRATRQRQE